MTSWLRAHAALLIALAIPVLFYLVTNLTRPLIPIDETRYLTVAWEYWVRGSWILPTLNFEPYSHKPPMLFWAINGFWTLFDTQNVWAARLPSLLAALATLVFTHRIARLMWPDKPDIATRAVLLLLILPGFMIYSSLIMFDTLLTVAVLLGVYAVLKFYLTEKRRYWLLLGLALGLGGLIKGPVILLHLLPVILLFPLWRAAKTGDKIVWAEGLFFALLFGVVITLAWALPAAHLGGPDYERMIFWGQSAGRMVRAFDHAQPIWFYLAVIPVLLLPWILMLRIKSPPPEGGPCAEAHIQKSPPPEGGPCAEAHIQNSPPPEGGRVSAQQTGGGDSGGKKNRLSFGWQWVTPTLTLPPSGGGEVWQRRFLLAWILPVFLAFCAISGKQIHYLFPLLPAGALFMAHLLHTKQRREHTIYLYPAIPLFIFTAGFFIVDEALPLFDHAGTTHLAQQLNHAPAAPMGMACLILIGIAFALKTTRRALPAHSGLVALAFATLLTLSALQVSVAPMLAKYYDLTPVGTEMRVGAGFGAPLAVSPKWEGEIGYLARLNRPITVLSRDQILPWLKQHKNGLILLRHAADDPPYGTRIVYTQPYRGANKMLSIITNKKVDNYP